MKTLVFIFTTLLITACQPLCSDNPASITFDIPAGSTLILNKQLPIDAGNTHAVIQHGKITSDKAKDLYNISCSLEMKAFGPRTVNPGSFNIKRIEDGQEEASGPNIIRYYTEVYLFSEHNSDIIKLECSAWGDRADGSFPVAEMQKALGDYFSFRFAKTTP